MVMKKEIREMQRQIHFLKEERSEVTSHVILEMVDEKITQFEAELAKMEREYNGESELAEVTVKKEQFGNDYPITVLNRAKENLNEKLSEINSGAYNKFSDEGIGYFKKTVLSDIADIEMAIELLQKYVPDQEDDEQ